MINNSGTKESTKFIHLHVWVITRVISADHRRFEILDYVEVAGGLGWLGALLSLDGWVDGVICLDKLGASVATTTTEWSYNLGQDDKEDKDKNCCCSSNHDACLGPGAVQPVGGVEPVRLVWKIIHYYSQFNQYGTEVISSLSSVSLSL